MRIVHIRVHLRHSTSLEKALAETVPKGDGLGIQSLVNTIWYDRCATRLSAPWDSCGCLRVGGKGRRINIHQEVILTMRKRRIGAGHSFDGLRGVSFKENYRRFQSMSQCKEKKPATYQLSLWMWDRQWTRWKHQRQHVELRCCRSWCWSETSCLQRHVGYSCEFVNYWKYLTHVVMLRQRGNTNTASVILVPSTVVSPG